MSLRAARRLFVAVLLACWPAAALAERTYTSDADLDEGVLDGVHHAAPQGHQLQLEPTPRTAPYLWVANTWQGTVTRLDTRTGQQVARYDPVLLGEEEGSAPGARPPSAGCSAPSRIAVDAEGNAFVLNRAADTPGCAGASASVTRLAASPEACVDRNLNGRIDTSRDVSGDGLIALDDPREFLGQQDECLLWTRSYGAPGDWGDSLAVDAWQDVWVAGSRSSKLYRLAGSTGELLQIIDPNAETGMRASTSGLAIGPGGLLYTSDARQRVLRKIDPGATTGRYVVGSLLSPVPTEGLAVDRSGIAWSGNAGRGGGVVRADFSTGKASLLGAGQGGCTGSTRGVAVDGQGHVWVACERGELLLRFGAPGTLLSSHRVGSGPLGVAADGAQLWIVHLTGDAVTRFDPATGQLQSFPAGGASEASSDLTGFSLRNVTLRQGSWKVVHDSGQPGSRWDTVTWNREAQGSVPAGAALSVSVRAADELDGLASRPFTEVSHGVPFRGVRGRYLQVKATLRMGPGGASPVLSDLSVAAAEGPNQAPVALCRNTSTCARSACASVASIDGGSHDPDGDVLSRSQSPEGPYPLGTTQVTLTVSDGSLRSTCSATVQVRDCAPPTLTCAAPVTAECSGGGAASVLLGSPTAVDACSTATVSGPVPSSFPPGTTRLLYSATDAMGNQALCQTHVTVVDTAAPRLSLLGPQVLRLPVGARYVEPGATAWDACSGNLTSRVRSSGTVDTSVPGSQTLTYSVVDDSGHVATLSRTVLVQGVAEEGGRQAGEPHVPSCPTSESVHSPGQGPSGACQRLPGSL
jgi:streptogramin lyase